jgi:hypothetical protein
VSSVYFQGHRVKPLTGLTRRAPTGRLTGPATRSHKKRHVEIELAQVSIRNTSVSVTGAGIKMCSVNTPVTFAIGASKEETRLYEISVLSPSGILAKTVKRFKK